MVDGASLGTILISTLPNSRPGILNFTEVDDEDSLARIQITEGHEYLYEWEGEPDQVDIQPTELFQPDLEGGGRGRLRPGLSTGLLRVRASTGGVEGGFELEVRSTKLDYLSEYRWMLRDIANGMSELVMSRFAASNMNFAIDPGRDAATLYQRFAFLQALLENDSFEQAINEIFRRPHVAWEDVEEECRIGQPMRPGSYVGRELTRPGPRAAHKLGALASVPRIVRSKRTDACRDTTPNRFVLFTLKRWLQVVSEIYDRLKAIEKPNAVESRALGEVARTVTKLERWTDEPLFRDVGPLSRFPNEDQVLQRRAGYRDVLKAYLEFELAARLSWKRIQDSYLAGQRDVAELYEYWAFIQLSRITAEIVGVSFDIERLIEISPDGLSVLLRRGHERVLSGTVDRFGRRLDVTLCFNRTYSRKNEGSWSREMRPDYSLLISPSKMEQALFTPIALHFDAKYRVRHVYEVLGEEEKASTETQSSEQLPEKTVVRDDLLKMHAYRDAIKRTAGAYVLYPGGEEAPTSLLEYHELLPGLGAFVFKPTHDGPVVGSASIRKFIVDVIDHVATRLTRHERGRFWLEQSHAHYEWDRPRPSIEIGGTPGPDVMVTLGYVRDHQHWKWILDRSAYNVRADDRPGALARDSHLLYNSLLLLYGPALSKPLLVRIVSEPEWVSRESMVATEYPAVHGSYWCVQIAPAARQPDIDALRSGDVTALAAARTGLQGAPTDMPWAELVKASRRASAA